MSDHQGIKNYAVVTASYWGFTLTDGAIRMLIVLYFYQLGYTPLAIASLFLFYEFFGIVTNLLGGWLASRSGLNTTLQTGMLLQVVALLMLTVPDQYLTVVYVMMVQALSGIAKDLNKMSAKASVKLMLPDSDHINENEKRLFKWIAVLTGSKNTLKGAGYFLGGFLLTVFEFQGALYVLASGLALILLFVFFVLPKNICKSKTKSKFSQLFSKSPAINWLSSARFFLFGARDIWFVVGLPLFLITTLGWNYTLVGSFLALWIILYGIIQAFAPKLIKRFHHGAGPDGKTALSLAIVLSLVPASMALLLGNGFNPAWVVISGLFVFAVIFAVNSSLHSYLIVSWSDKDQVATNVGFYYMANAGGRLTGTILSGWLYQQYDLTGCLIVSALFVILAALFSTKLPDLKQLSRL